MFMALVIFFLMPTRVFRDGKILVLKSLFSNLNILYAQCRLKVHGSTGKDMLRLL
jgi:hypothetical protein